MTAFKLAKDLYGSRFGELGFVIGSGPSLAYAKKKLSNPPYKHTFTIAVNRAITEVPADYWLWIDQIAYTNWKDHPNAQKAVKVGVDKWADAYDEDVYLWERVIGNTKDGLDKGNLVHRNTSMIAAISFAFRLGAVRIVTVGCENFIPQDQLDAMKKEEGGELRADYMLSTFIRVAEALRNRKYWLHPKVMLADASRTGLDYGRLNLPKTTIGGELELVEAFWNSRHSEERKKKLWLPSQP